MDNTRYLLLPDAYADGKCKLINVVKINAIDKLEQHEEYYVDEDTGEMGTTVVPEHCIITYGPDSTAMKNWRATSRTIKVEISLAELLQLINSKAAYHTSYED